MSETVVTIYFCGTGENRDKPDNIVPHSWSVTGGSRVWLNEGVGNCQHYILKSEKILKKVGKGKGSSEKSFGRLHKTVFDNLSGIGSQDTIINTLQWLWMEYYRPDKPKFSTINLCGWSRGAVACIMLAHAIEEAGFRRLIPALEVNIFAIDPVPGATNDFGGGGSFETTGRSGTPDSLSKCVANYQAVLAENVGGAIGPAFRNVSPDFSGDRRGGPSKTEFPLPGAHSTVAKFGPGNPVGLLALSLCHRFLLSHGSEILAPRVMTEAEELEKYAEILIKHGGFKTKGIFHKKRSSKNGMLP
ncbi:MAG: hypothetical protein O2985_16485 [Proteobacteria bacterium]|nr:hypothetical protein [Pseudomonadota bacterium]